MKLVQWFCRRWNVKNLQHSQQAKSELKCSVLWYLIPSDKGVTLYSSKLSPHRSNILDYLCKVWKKIARWLWRIFIKSFKFDVFILFTVISHWKMVWSLIWKNYKISFIPSWHMYLEPSSVEISPMVLQVSFIVIPQFSYSPRIASIL